MYRDNDDDHFSMLMIMNDDGDGINLTLKVSHKPD